MTEQFKGVIKLDVIDSHHRTATMQPVLFGEIFCEVITFLTPGWLIDNLHSKAEQMTVFDPCLQSLTVLCSQPSPRRTLTKPT